MKTRTANKIKSQLVTLVFGANFSGKSTIALQLSEFKRTDGKPFRVAVIDAENGGCDKALEKLIDKGIDGENIKVFYTNSLMESKEIVRKIKNHEPFYEYDDDGNETDTVMLDADGEVFRPDGLVVDGTSVFKMTSEQGLLELSKKRNTVKANKDNLTGMEKFVRIEGADLEFKDYKKLNYTGQDFVLDLMACGVSVILTSREADEKVQVKDEDGKSSSVATGRKTFDTFKGIDYNVNTILHMISDEESGIVFAEVLKDRTEVHKKGEVLENPSLLDWQVVIDKNAGRDSFIISNDLDHAVRTEQKMYEKEIMGEELAYNTNNNRAKSRLDLAREEFTERTKSLTQLQRKSLKSKFDEIGFPYPPKINEIEDTELIEKAISLLPDKK